MTQQSQKKNKPANNTSSVSEQQVVDYLREHPEFFNLHPVLLTEMEIPHDTGTAVSLIERQVYVLRNKNSHLENKLRELVVLARENEQLSRSILQLVINLIGSEDLEDLLRAVVDALRHEFQVDFATVRLLTDDSHLYKHSPQWYVDERDDQLDSFRSALQANRPICGRLSQEQIAYLFPEHTEEVKSAALIPLVSGDILGYIGLGGQHEDRFHPGMGTTFLTQISELVSAAICQYRS